jgi:hypothetical protein
MDLDGAFENTVEFFTRMPKRREELDDATRADARDQGHGLTLRRPIPPKPHLSTIKSSEYFGEKSLVSGAEADEVKAQRQP